MVRFGSGLSRWLISCKSDRCMFSEVPSRHTRVSNGEARTTFPIRCVTFQTRPPHGDWKSLSIGLRLTVPSKTSFNRFEIMPWARAVPPRPWSNCLAGVLVVTSSLQACFKDEGCQHHGEIISPSTCCIIGPSATM